MRTCMAADAVVLLIALAAARLTAGAAAPTFALVLSFAFPALTLGLAYGRRPSHTQIDASALDASANALSAVSVACMAIVLLSAALGIRHSLLLALRLWLFSSALLVLSRCALLEARRRALRDPKLGTPTLIVGTGIVAQQLGRRLLDPRYGMRPVGFLDSDPLPTSDPDAELPVLGGRDDFAAALAQSGARQVIVAFSAEPDRNLLSMLDECQRLGVGVALVPRLFESVSNRATLDHVGGLPLLRLAPTDPFDWRFAIKHAFDRACAALALVAFAPLLAAIAAAVRLSSPGPILFRQLRVGRDGRPFHLLKFRTMREADGPAAFLPLPGRAPGGVEGADRRTRIGSFLRDYSLDELPQLINVLRGEMSIVGPRPERPEFVGRFSTEVDGYARRHRVKAGITGWAQINGLRGQTSIADRAEWDNYYIRNWSLGLDLRIIARTVLEVLRPQHVPQAEPAAPAPGLQLLPPSPQPAALPRPAALAEAELLPMAAEGS
jgi:exopolysaccharide biosynthesis polyprenyl glycosylphosphotransferase